MNTAKLIVESNFKIEKTLKAWINQNRFPHAVLIEGINGIGKNEIARYIAAAILCGNEAKPCGVCTSCVKVEKKIHPDLLLYQGEGRVNSFHVDTVREIKKESYIAPNDSPKKVFILNQADNMTIAAQNALLKIVEEPPKNVTFILICENKNKMLLTIRSRTIALTAELLNNEIILQILKEELPEFSTEEYQTAVLVGRGNIAVAKSYLQNPEVREQYNIAAGVWNSLKKKNEVAAMAKIISFERDKQQFINQLELIRILVEKDLKNNEKRGLSCSQLIRIIDIIDEIKVSINFNVNMLIATTIFVDKISNVIRN